MIMAAPFPSGLSQNVQIFLPLTDLDYRTHSCDLRAKHGRMTQAWMLKTQTVVKLINKLFVCLVVCLMNVNVLSWMLISDVGQICPLLNWKRSSIKICCKEVFVIRYSSHEYGEITDKFCYCYIGNINIKICLIISQHLVKFFFRTDWTLLWLGIRKWLICGSVLDGSVMKGEYLAHDTQNLPNSKLLFIQKY